MVELVAVSDRCSGFDVVEGRGLDAESTGGLGLGDDTIGWISIDGSACAEVKEEVVNSISAGSVAIFFFWLCWLKAYGLYLIY